MKPLNDVVVKRINIEHSDLIVNMPYVLENKINKERTIVTLKTIDSHGLAFVAWDAYPCKTIILSAADVGKYDIYKADLKDGAWLIFKDDSVSASISPDISNVTMQKIREIVNSGEDALLNQSFDNVIKIPINETNCALTGSIVCYRKIDYKNQKTDECVTKCIEYFYTERAHMTKINQFLYKVNRVKTPEEDYVTYSILYPVSESDKREYMDKGWKIHPMFNNKKSACYENSVVLMGKHVIDANFDESDSITIEILSGLQLLYLIEYGLNEKDNKTPGKYAGIEYVNGQIVISNAYTNTTNELIIDDDVTVKINDVTGYISRFKYWDEEYDWLLFPEETSKEPTICDTSYIGPSKTIINKIKWGTDNPDSLGIFHYWMFSTDAYDGDCIVSWEFRG